MQLLLLILIRWIVICPMDSSIQRLNNHGQVSSCKTGKNVMTSSPSKKVIVLYIDYIVDQTHDLPMYCIFTTEWTFTTNTPIKIYIFSDGRPLLRGNHTFKIPQKSNGLTYGLCGSMLKNLMSNRCNVNSWNLLLGQEYRFCWKHHYRVIWKFNVFFNDRF